MRTTIAFALLATALLLPTPLWAQNSSGNSSRTGSSGTTWPSTNSSSSNSGTTSSNQNNSTPSNFDNNAFQARINTALQRGDDFLRSGRSSNTTSSNGTFVGADLNDLRDFLGMTKPRQARTRMNSLGTGTNSTSSRGPGAGTRRGSTPGGSTHSLTGGRQPSDGTTETSDSLRAALRVGIDEPPTSAAVGAQLTAQLQQAQPRGGNPSLNVELDGGVATLRGTVSNAHECAVCEQMIALQPGVHQVKNLLTVTPVAKSTPQP